MNKPIAKSYKTYEETYNKPIKSYIGYDDEGKEITIMPKIPTHHKSNHPIEQRPTYFYNLDQILLSPDLKKVSTSQNEIALKNSKQGTAYEFYKNGYVESLNMPGVVRKNETSVVIVFYGNDGINFTKSYRSEVKYG